MVAGKRNHTRRSQKRKGGAANYNNENNNIIELNNNTNINNINIATHNIINSKLPIVGLYIPGLGCHQMSDLEEYSREFMHRYNYDEFHTLCNNNIHDTIRNIAMRIIRLRPSQKRDFIQQVYSIVIYYLQHSYRIIIIGHSYGGSVVSRIAELLSIDDSISNALRNHVQMATFGSIYIPKPNRTVNTHIFHFMDSNDISLKIIPYKPPRGNYGYYIDDDNKIVWLNNGINGKWNTHNNAYQTILLNILQAHTIYSPF